MQKSTTVLSVPLEQLESQLRDVESWPLFLPDLVAAGRTSEGRYTFTVRLEGEIVDIPVIVRRSPRGHGLLWTVIDGPAWNGHLYLELVDAFRTRAHLELVLEAGSFIGHLTELLGTGGARAELGLRRLQDVASHTLHTLHTLEDQEEDDIIVLPAVPN